MDHKRISSTTQIILIVICILIAITAAFLIGLFWGQKSYETAFKTGYETGWQAAEKRLEDGGFIFPEEEIINTVNGTIIEINTDSFTLEAEQASSNPLATNPIERTVNINNDTIIYQNIEKDPETVAAEQQVFDEALAQLGPDEEVPDPPSFYETQEIEFSDLEIGSRVSVSAEENIGNATSIDAAQVDMYMSIEPEVEPADDIEPEESIE